MTSPTFAPINSTAELHITGPIFLHISPTLRLMITPSSQGSPAAVTFIRDISQRSHGSTVSLQKSGLVSWSLLETSQSGRCVVPLASVSYEEL
jgi:hypothetical protein